MTFFERYTLMREPPKMKKFKSFDKKKQRQVLGELVFPLIRSFCSVTDEGYQRRICGMLVDLNSGSVEKILDLWSQNFP